MNYAEKVRKEALDCVNEFRKAQGKDTVEEFEPGCRSSSQNCPIAKTLGAHVNDIDIYFPDKKDAILAAEVWDVNKTAEKSVSHPNPIKEFIELFDDGTFPDLIEE